MVSFATGYGSSCAILDDGDETTPSPTKCWGKGTMAPWLRGRSDQGDGQYEMGNYLPTVDLGTSLHATSIDVGDAFACAILNNSQVKAGDRDGREDRARKERCDWRRVRRWATIWNTWSCSCLSPRWTSPATCPPREALLQETLDSSSSYVGNKTSTAMTPDSCGAVVYVDETNDVVRFGIFYKGKWSTEVVYEYVGEDNRVKDVSLTIDATECHTLPSPTSTVLDLAIFTTRPS